MLYFLIIFAVSIAALLALQTLDVECAQPPRRLRPKTGRRAAIRAAKAGFRASHV